MRYCIVMICCVFAVVTAGEVFGQDVGVGFFKSVTGEVLLIRGDERLPVEAGRQLKPADIVVTRGGGYAGIVLQDGTRITVGPRSELSLQDYVFSPHQSDYECSFFLKRGSMIYSSGKMGKLAPEKINLKTPRATVGIRGTKLLLSVN